MRSPFRDDLEDCVLAAQDMVRLSGLVLERIEGIRANAKEIERQLNCVDTDMRDPYNPIVRSIRLAEEILDATD
tara:strand:- start:184 stop:405 length:222 start_codon:yes stop_codon:yes gene_type:complete